MSLNVKMRLLELDYEWDETNKIHMLTWDQDYPINVTGLFTKVFRPYHAFTVGDKVTLNGEVYAFTDLKNLAARTNAFVADQYVPIAIDLDEKRIAYYSPSGAGTGSGEVVHVAIGINDWVNKQYLERITDMSTDMVVVLGFEPNISTTEQDIIIGSCITADITTEGVLFKCETLPTIPIHLQLVIL